MVYDARYVVVVRAGTEKASVIAGPEVVVS